MDFRSRFKLAVLQADATQFEALFSKIKRYKHNDFKQVKPHGNIGDRGNDGWQPSSGTYYQVYAPEELSTNTETAQTKVKEDFKKLKQYWEKITPIRRFYFVLNDKFKGVSPHIWKTLSEIKSTENLDDSGIYDTAALENDLFSLNDDQICSVLEVSPALNFPNEEDQKKVREFLDYFSMAFEELFQRGSEAGYFFPTCVMDKYSDWLRHDWNYQRLKSKDKSIAQHQEAIRQTLIAMFQQIRSDPYYDHIGLSFKYKPPYELKDRNQLIDQRRDSMGQLIWQMKKAYERIKFYAA